MMNDCLEMRNNSNPTSISRSFGSPVLSSRLNVIVVWVPFSELAPFINL